MNNFNSFNLKNILNNDLLEQIQNFIDPNQILSKEDIKIIKDNIKNIPLDENEQKLILFHIEKDINNYFDDFGEFQINEKNFSLHQYVQNIRNQCKEYYYENLIENNFFYMSEYIKNFYKSFENISGDIFMEIEGLLNQVEYIKQFKIRDLILSHTILDSNYHRNYKDRPREINVSLLGVRK